MKEITINLHFTDLCNFSCKHCFVRKQRYELPFKEVCLIVDKIAEHALKNGLTVRINLAGGEPLISRNIQSIIDYIFDKKIEVSIITNGYYLTKEFIEQNKNKISMIGISIDSLHHKTNYLIGRCEDKNIISEKELLEKCFLIKKNGIKLKVNTCITSLNKNEDLSDFFKKVQPDRLKILRVLSEKKDESFLITDQDWVNTQDKYKDLNAIFEDNDFMKENYIIIDSFGNLTKNNLHLSNNSILKNSIESCFDNLNNVVKV